MEQKQQKQRDFLQKYILIQDNEDKNLLNNAYKQYLNIDDSCIYYVKQWNGLSKTQTYELKDTLDNYKYDDEILNYDIQGQNDGTYNFRILITEEQFLYKYQYEKDEQYYLENYEQKEFINSGRFGRVYKAIDLRNNNRKVAVKITKVNQEIQFKYMVDEITIKEKQIQCLLQYYDCFFVVDKNLQQTIYMVTELMNGDLTQLIGQQVWEQMKFFQNEYLNIFYQITQSLIKLKDCKTYHRDIKPENVFYKINVDKLQIKIGDFSSIKIKKETKFSSISDDIGSPFYMAPEYSAYQIENDENKLDLEKCDVYSLGVTFIEILYAPNKLTTKIFKKKKENEKSLNDFRQSIQNDTLFDFIMEMVDDNNINRPTYEQVMCLEQDNKNNIEKTQLYIKYKDLDTNNTVYIKLQIEKDIESLKFTLKSIQNIFDMQNNQQGSLKILDFFYIQKSDLISEFHIYTVIGEISYQQLYKYEQNLSYLHQNYEFIQKTSRGGQGYVYLVFDKKTKKKYQIKKSDQIEVKNLVKYLEKEFKIQKIQSQSEQIINYKEIFFMGPNKYLSTYEVNIVMEYMEGDIFNLLQIESLEQEEQINLIHKDVKPSNIVYKTEQEKKTLKIIDFETLMESEDQQMLLDIPPINEIYTSRYMPPKNNFLEQNKVTFEKYDVFSLGITFSEILMAPNIIQKYQFVQHHYFYEQIAPNIDDYDLKQLLGKMLNYNTNEWPSIKEIWQKVLQIQQQQQIQKSQQSFGDIEQINPNLNLKKKDDFKNVIDSIMENFQTSILDYGQNQKCISIFGQ
ncbi:Protein kinase-like domain [Pseudocohnilembus persalinus]|uniref:Protein kinase-like domain n=1 Tax=Pseudocohnilembus persalinus TaxID=266149 RepID=A0A0V0QLU3_PSEPJ|nr:Protein kinase-like domain [Pseudocohnilembus persalinus]|eukprot:KRX03127.1 Protein kinase-like domain [Pseudocohnilembus persalinus]